MYGLTVEAFKYNGELLDTGMDEIDRVANHTAYSLEYDVNAGGTGTYSMFERAYQGASLATATATGIVCYWNKPDRKLHLRNIKGAFTANTLIKGASSGAQWTLTTAPNVLDNANETDLQDNELLETEGDNIIDFTEINPFGEP